ncbi:2(OG)-Fe(II) oxygenase family oxidoreductase [Nitzschia inconspicua]|uniref:2(OG)-Fe(II) oxygenase family oxidoreductase n=1 Tax=Nitzschia inconspicua TaxID=303405 RepID=A0A9K3K6Y4_9STRA|nr:2(OG)-Fe(II) oxygenase family oxidoreductase [Nitzschia inconspicua]
MVSSCDIPSINLQPFFEDKGVVIGDTPTTEQMEAAATIHQACQKHGFVHVNNFGLSESFGERLFAASKDLFSVADKHDLVPWHPSHNTGYSPYKSESLNVNRPADLKEAFNVRFPPTSTNPSLSKTPMSFQEIVDDEFFRKLQTAAIRYSMACALALDLPIDFFSKTLKKFDQCTGPMGLQVKSVEGGEVGGSAGGEEADGWKDVVVPSSPDDTNNHNKTGDENETTTATTSFGAIINTGAMLARWTNDHWKATAHRVVVPNAEIASQDRYSIAFFVDPDADEFIEVDPKFAGDGKCCYEPIRSRDFLSMKLNEMTLI